MPRGGPAEFYSLQGTAGLDDYLERAGFEGDNLAELKRDIASASATGLLAPANSVTQETSATRGGGFSEEVKLGRKTLYATPAFVQRWREAWLWNFSLGIDGGFWFFNEGRPIKTNTMFEKWSQGT